VPSRRNQRAPIRYDVETEIGGVTYRGKYFVQPGRIPMLTVESDYGSTTTTAGAGPETLARIILGEQVRNSLR
jgi:hypothetical protein